MATQRYISTSFWTDKWIRSLDPSERYLYMYLLTNPQTNIAGVYQITIDRIAFDTGYDERTLLPMLDRFAKAGKAYFFLDEWVVLPSWPKHQKADKKATIKSGIETILHELPEEVLRYIISVDYQYPIGWYQYEPSYSDSDSDSDSDIDTDIDSDTKTAPHRSSRKKEHKEKYGPLKNVFLTEKEYRELYKDYGPWSLEEYLKKLSYWKPNAKVPCRDDNARIRKWMEEDKIPRQTPENIAIMEGKE